MKKLINKHGGSTAVHRKTTIPLRTVEDWKAGKTPAGKWVRPMLTFWLEGIIIIRKLKRKIDALERVAEAQAAEIDVLRMRQDQFNQEQISAVFDAAVNTTLIQNEHDEKERLELILREEKHNA